MLLFTPQINLVKNCLDNSYQISWGENSNYPVITSIDFLVKCLTNRNYGSIIAIVNDNYYQLQIMWNNILLKTEKRNEDDISRGQDR